MTRCGIVALAGRPNVGKSSLLNALVGERLGIVSPKPQSTRVPVVGLLTDGDTQLVFSDCPGLLEPTYRLQEVMRQAALAALADADVIAYLHPLSEHPAPPLGDIAGLASPPRAPVVTVYTKADLVPAARRPRLVPPDAAVVSVVSGEGIGALRTRLGAAVPVGPWLYDPEQLATQPLRFFAAEFVREAAFAQLAQELPYSVTCVVEEFRESTDPVYIRAVLYVERASQKGMVIGREGHAIRAIGTAARSRIEQLVERRVYLDLHVKVLPAWRRRDAALKRLGYLP